MNFLLGSMWTSIKCEFKLPIKKKKKKQKKSESKIWEKRSFHPWMKSSPLFVLKKVREVWCLNCLLLMVLPWLLQSQTNSAKSCWRNWAFWWVTKSKPCRTSVYQSQEALTNLREVLQTSWKTLKPESEWGNKAWQQHSQANIADCEGGPQEKPSSSNKEFGELNKKNFLSIYFGALSWVLNGSGAKWFTSLIDDCTRVTWIFLLKQKSEVNNIFPIFHSMVKNQFKVCIKKVRIDNARDYFNQILSPYFQKEGIINILPKRGDNSWVILCWYTSRK